jgi:ABC-2 type transport system ATP-binding protein
MSAVISISNLTKTYASGLVALRSINLEIRKGEIFALLGPNGAGKTTLISIVCGIVTPSHGKVLADGHDILRESRAARFKIGLVPQELTTDTFETVWDTVTFSRGLFGHGPNPAHIEKTLRALSLWEKRNDKVMTLSGGMKRRVMIAKALAHEPQILFLDEPTAGVDVELRREPTAGVDVELRRDMWTLVRGLRDSGVTIILTTHYIDEAEEMADRIGVIHKGELIVVEEKTQLMKKLGKKQLTLNLQEAMLTIPSGLSDWHLELQAGGSELVYTFDAHDEHTDIPALLKRVGDLGVGYKDLNTHQSSLEDIFVSLVSDRT